MNTVQVTQSAPGTQIRKHKHLKKTIGAEMAQLSFDFNASPQFAESVRAESIGDVPNLLEIPVEPKFDELGNLELELDNGSYIQLAINLLLTAAEDLVAIEKTLSKENLHGKTRIHANLLKQATVRWLSDELPQSPFQFSDCVALLEDELRFQSMGQIHVPDIVGRSDELAQWILDDPHTAKDVLSRYLTIFSRNDYDYEETMGYADDDSGYERSRPRA